jgi:hypothetical protein
MKKTSSESEATASIRCRICRALREGWRILANVCQMPESTEHHSPKAVRLPEGAQPELSSAKILVFPPQPVATSTPSEPVSEPEVQSASSTLPPQVAKSFTRSRRQDSAEEIKIERRRRWQAVALVGGASCGVMLALAALLSFESNDPAVRDWLTAAIASEPKTDSFGNGSSVEFNSDTRLSANADGNPCHITMTLGEATFDVKANLTEPVLVSSPLAVARAESDAKFTMTVDKATSVYVLEGEIELIVAGTAVSTKVKRGQKGIVSPDSPWTVLVAEIAADERPRREHSGRWFHEPLRMARVSVNRLPARPRMPREARPHDTIEGLQRRA